MKETAQHRFESMTQWRSVALRRAIDNSALTLPTLIPESDQADPLSPTWNNIPSLYQGVGARGVNSLAARLLLSLYPPAVPFFRLTMDASKIRDYAAANGGQEEDITSKLDQVLSSMERQMLRRLLTRCKHALLCSRH